MFNFLRKKTQPAASAGRYYGGDQTIHRTGYVDVETDSKGRVVSVWFRCQPLPFKQTVVGVDRANDMRGMYEKGPENFRLLGVQVSE